MNEKIIKKLKSSRSYLEEKIVKQLGYCPLLKKDIKIVEPNVYEVTFTKRVVKGELDLFDKWEEYGEMIAHLQNN